jgi:phosphonate metabolism protein (transferase hexapeptide repeat family)
MARLSADAPFCHPDCNITNCSFGRFTELGLGTRIQNTELGDYSYTDRYADIANAKIGKFANIAAFSRIGPTAHPMEQASLHHMLYRSDDYWAEAPRWTAFFAHRASRITTLGHDTWIGSQAQIMPEVTVGTGAVVAAGAVVTKDVAPYMIVAGVPAAPIRERFPAAIADRMQSLSWWDWSHEDLYAALADFRTLKAEAFLEKYER